MFDFDKLKGLIVEKYGTRAAFAKAMGLNPGQLSVRLSGQTPFKTAEIVQAVKLLEIDSAEIGLYFFTPKVR